LWWNPHRMREPKSGCGSIAIKTMSKDPIRVLIVDDHPLMREALRAAIDDEPDMVVAAEAGNGEEAVSLAGSQHPDVIVMDLLMPGMGGLKAIAEIVKREPRANILALTSSSEEEKVVAAVQAGAAGYLLKDARRVEILQGIRQVSRGQAYLPPQMASKLLTGLRHNRIAALTDAPDHQTNDALVEMLTPREQEVLVLIGQGISNRDIAAHLFLSDGTVRTHVHHILAKLNLKSRSQAILYAMKMGTGNEADGRT
jgi:DNA-binding NarL/FixJ family response regulator